jgi:transposase
LAVAAGPANLTDNGGLLPLLDLWRGGRLGDGRQVLADRGYDSQAIRVGVLERGYTPRIAKRGRPGQGRRADTQARERSVIERTFAWLSYFRRLATRWERRGELYLAFLQLGCALVCWRRLERTSN